MNGKNKPIKTTNTTTEDKQVNIDNTDDDLIKKVKRHKSGRQGGPSYQRYGKIYYYDYNYTWYINKLGNNLL